MKRSEPTIEKNKATYFDIKKRIETAAIIQRSKVVDFDVNKNDEEEFGEDEKNTYQPGTDKYLEIELTKLNKIKEEINSSIKPTIKNDDSYVFDDDNDDLTN